MLLVFFSQFSPFCFCITLHPLPNPPVIVVGTAAERSCLASV